MLYRNIQSNTNKIKKTLIIGVKVALVLFHFELRGNIIVVLIAKSKGSSKE